MKVKRNGPRGVGIVVYPHSDDAALSVSGSILEWKKTHRIVLVCVFTKSLWSIHHESVGFSIPKVTRWRMREEKKFAQRMGARLIHLGLEEAPIRLRLHESRRPLSLQKAKERLFRAPGYAVVKTVAEKLKPILSKFSPEWVLGPLGVGRHMDHVATREATLRLVRGLRKQRWHGEAYLYEDFPYTLYDRHGSRRTLDALKARGWGLVEHWVDITKQRHRKYKAIQIYKSQFHGNDMSRMVLNHNRKWGRGKSYTERLWSLHPKNGTKR